MDKNNRIKWIAFIIVILLVQVHSRAQQIDILLQGGHVIDPRNNIDAIMDVAIQNDRITQVAPSIDAGNAALVVDVSGLYVTPGVLDIHSHNFFGTESNAYLSNSFTALPPDGFTFRTGVTTVVDVGGAGWRNFQTFKEQTIDNSRTRVLSFLNIVGSGMKGGATEQNVADMDAKLTAMAARQYKELVVGVKLAHYQGEEWEPAEIAVQAGRLADIPVMIDFGGADPPLSIEKLFLDVLRPGDIFTHAYAHVNGREPIVDDKGKLKPFILKARDRGIVFDVGHGGGSFLFEQAIPAIKQGLKPTTISTDFHTGSMNAGMKDMANVMSKFLNMGLSIQEVIEASTWKPAVVIKREELGHLSVGAVADVAVFKLETGDFGFTDVRGWKINGDQKLTAELTLRAGDVVWDLNGISKKEWQSK